MTESPEHAGELDPARSVVVLVVGQKGTGKTELGDVLFRSYPYDKVLLDLNGDMKTEPEAIELDDPPPARWPARAALDRAASERIGRKPRHHTLVYRPDFGDPGYGENIDRAIGLAFSHEGKTACFVDEAHDAFPAGQMIRRPHARRAIRHSRHGTLTLIMATPRPMTITPLCISQADWVYVFKLRSPADRKRVVDNIGWTPKEFDEAIFSLGDHEYLRYEGAANGGAGELLIFPPLPAHLLRHHKPG
jgi:hypothetical protein